MTTKKKRKKQHPQRQKRTQPVYKDTPSGFIRNGSHIIVERRNRSVSSVEESLRT